jgi:hypothetical protein
MPLYREVQRVLFEDISSPPLPTLSQDLQAKVLTQMVPWMQAVAIAINEEVRDEQDHR